MYHPTVSAHLSHGLTFRSVIKRVVRQVTGKLYQHCCLQGMELKWNNKFNISWVQKLFYNT